MKKLNTLYIFKLIEKFNQGDEENFNKLTIYFRDYVFRIALRYLHSREDAEDLTQEVFIKLYQNLKDFKFKSDFKTYLYRITVNSACNYYKKKKRHQSYITGLSENLLTKKNSADEKIIEKEFLFNLEKAVLNLNENHKTIIILKDFQNLTYKQIAQKLNITKNAAKIRRHYALKKLREQFTAAAR